MTNLTESMTKEERNAHQSVYSNLSTSKPAVPSAAQELGVGDCLCEGGKDGYLKRRKKEEKQETHILRYSRYCRALFL